MIFFATFFSAGQNLKAQSQSPNMSSGCPPCQQYDPYALDCVPISDGYHSGDDICCENGEKISNDKCCGEELLEPGKFCCTEDGDQPETEGVQVASSEDCCDGKPLEGNEECCAGKEIYDPTEDDSDCCEEAQEVYHSDVQYCCKEKGSVEDEGTPEYGCCDKNDGDDSRNENGMKCCEGTEYDSSKACCKNGKVVTGLNDIQIPGDKLCFQSDNPQAKTFSITTDPPGAENSVTWTFPGGDPPTGTGASVDVKWGEDSHDQEVEIKAEICDKIPPKTKTVHVAWNDVSGGCNPNTATQETDQYITDIKIEDEKADREPCPDFKTIMCSSYWKYTDIEFSGTLTRNFTEESLNSQTCGAELNKQIDGGSDISISVGLNFGAVSVGVSVPLKGRPQQTITGAQTPYYRWRYQIFNVTEKPDENGTVTGTKTRYLTHFYTDNVTKLSEEPINESASLTGAREEMVGKHATKKSCKCCPDNG